MDENSLHFFVAKIAILIRINRTGIRLGYVLCSGACTCFCVLNVRQNRKERLMQKKWSHIDPQLFSPLDEKEVSLKVNKASFGGNGFKTAGMQEFCEACAKWRV